MGAPSRSADLMRGLKSWQRLVLVMSLCLLVLPFWFAAENTYRFVDGHHTTTDGYVRCEEGGLCHGTWQLPGGQYGSGEITGMRFEYDEELITDIPIFADRNWGVRERSSLIVRAVAQSVGGALGMSLVLFLAGRPRGGPRDGDGKE
ncbi:hypothetical protein DTL70_30575 [Streptomyces diacarni]|uniref:Uncharacterized protein n=2 Tax=Streptomyces diacarni TaxID=2800381 RepID=A0A367EDG5_9ACTN|nr:hypothetical protein DTL70_30575 [Streptomyces diacarni]